MNRIWNSTCSVISLAGLWWTLTFCRLVPNYLSINVFEFLSDQQNICDVTLSWWKRKNSRSKSSCSCWKLGATLEHSKRTSLQDSAVPGKLSAHIKTAADGLSQWGCRLIFSVISFIAREVFICLLTWFLLQSRLWRLTDSLLPSSQFPDNLPCSVALQPAAHDVGKVRWWLRERTGSDEVNTSQKADVLSSSVAMCGGVWDQSVQRRESGRQSAQTVSLSYSDIIFRGRHTEFHSLQSVTRTLCVSSVLSFLTCPTGAQCRWCSGRFNTHRRAKERRPLLRSRRTSSCRKNHFTSRPVWTKRWGPQIKTKLLHKHSKKSVSLGALCSRQSNFFQNQQQPRSVKPQTKAQDSQQHDEAVL